MLSLDAAHESSVPGLCFVVPQGFQTDALQPFNLDPMQVTKVGMAEGRSAPPFAGGCHQPQLDLSLCFTLFAYYAHVSVVL